MTTYYFVAETQMQGFTQKLTGTVKVDFDLKPENMTRMDYLFDRIYHEILPRWASYTQTNYNNTFISPIVHIASNYLITFIFTI